MATSSQTVKITIANMTSDRHQFRVYNGSDIVQVVPLAFTEPLGGKSSTIYVPRNPERKYIIVGSHIWLGRKGSHTFSVDNNETTVKIVFTASGTWFEPDVRISFRVTFA